MLLHISCAHRNKVISSECDIPMDFDKNEYPNIFMFKQARKLQDAQAVKLTSCKADKLTSCKADKDP